MWISMDQKSIAICALSVLFSFGARAQEHNVQPRYFLTVKKAKLAPCRMH
jgi:hypothetical protein